MLYYIFEDIYCHPVRFITGALSSFFSYTAVMKSHLAGLLFFYTLSSWAAPQCRDIFFALDYLPREQHRHELQKEEKLNNRLLNTNWFVTSRGLIEYISEFSKSKTGPNLDLQ